MRIDRTMLTVHSSLLRPQVEAFQGNIIMPNKHVESYNKMFDGHLLESETYVGGHVEALKAGVYRSDIPNNFALSPETAQQLIDDLDAALTFSIKVEGNLKMEDVENFEEVRNRYQLNAVSQMDTQPMSHESVF